MPIAKVDAAWFASKAGEYRAGYLTGNVQREQFNYYEAFDTAKDWRDGGVLIGSLVGCAVGAALTVYVASVGCVAFAASGAQIGGVAGGVIGFFVGGYELRYKDSFDWGPDKIYTGR